MRDRIIALIIVLLIVITLGTMVMLILRDVGIEQNYINNLTYDFNTDLEDCLKILKQRTCETIIITEYERKERLGKWKK